ncbi:MAG: bifunctional 3,4-dihydroxy-2-butanone-4-phosphate synthase/GTP cyclohydrolase II [Actinomycetota bacterium]
MAVTDVSLEPTPLESVPTMEADDIAEPTLATIEQAVEAIARGEIVIVVDDPGRENEGDFVMAAEKVTPDAVNFMVTHGRGLLCMPMSGDRLDALGLRAMVPENEAGAETAFTISIDLKQPRNTGISAYDRARTIRRALDAGARADEFRTPGHVFPLRARPGGVLERAGHTEAAVDLARLAGLRPAGAICEIMNADGTMARVPDLVEVARRHGLLMIAIADLIAYRARTEALVERVADARIPTPYGPFSAVGYRSHIDGREHLALVFGHPEGSRGTLVRVHSECLTGDAFGSLRCDCGAQLRESMRLIAQEGEGVIVYVKGHEGRGIGIMQKLLAYRLQDAGADTVEANLMLGHPADARDYLAAAKILQAMDVDDVRLLTNNPAKRSGLESYGVAVRTRIPLVTVPTEENLRYLQTKRVKFSHDLLEVGLA